jgi:putative isomerase
MMPQLDRRTLLSGFALQATGWMAKSRLYAQPWQVSGLTSSWADEVSPRDRKALIDYFAANARKLLREPGGVLRFPSVSPSLPRATYSTSLWDWDTLWTVRGLFRIANLTQDTQLHADVAAHARGCIANFFEHQSDEGRIPMLISLDDPDPLGCLKGQRPHKENQAKPVLAQLALLIADETHDASWFSPYFEKLQRFYSSWTADNLSQTGLLVWGDDVAIGNDNDPTTFGRPFFSSANLLLNCLYYQDLLSAAEVTGRLGRSDEKNTFHTQAQSLGNAIQKNCWDRRDGFFYTADVQCVDRRRELIPNIPRGMDMSWRSIPLRIQTFTGFLPMWCKLTSPEQNKHLLRHLNNPETFAGRYGIRSLSAQEPMYSLVASTNPSNWLGPIWVIVNYFIWSGLEKNGYAREARFLAARTAKMLAADLASSGSLNEYYHPDTGKPLSHKGFMDWNLLVLEMI